MNELQNIIAAIKAEFAKQWPALPAHVEFDEADETYRVIVGELHFSCAIGSDDDDTLTFENEADEHECVIVEY